jgi:hypothetical protein
MSGWVKSGECSPWTALRESVHSGNFPGRRLPTASSALQSASSSVIKTEVKEFSQNLTAFPFKIKKTKNIQSSETHL